MAGQARYACAVSVHRVYIGEPGLTGLDTSSPREAGQVVRIQGEEAHHLARVRRLATGDAVELLDGRGLRARALVGEIHKSREGWELVLNVSDARIEPKPCVRLEVFAAAAKGDRLEEMIDGLSQVGADAYRPLRSRRTVVDPREGKLERLRRVAVESLKQCGRAWVLEIGDAIDLEAGLQGGATDHIIVADASGVEASRLTLRQGCERVVLLVGPEGGWSDEERARFVSAGTTLVRLGAHVLRVETAAVVGAARLREAIGAQ